MLLLQVPPVPLQVWGPVRVSPVADVGAQLESEFLMNEYGLAPEVHLEPAVPWVRSLVPWMSIARIGRTLVVTLTVAATAAEAWQYQQLLK